MKILSFDEFVNEKSVGGNSGYVGYSMSKRALAARKDGKFPKTDFKKEYQMSEKVLQTLTSIGVIDDKEWHHTSKFGNKTTFYAFEEGAYLKCWEEHKNEIVALVRKGETEELLKFFDDYLEKENQKVEQRRLEDIQKTKEYNNYVETYKKEHDKFDKNGVFKASNGCLVSVENGLPVVTKDGNRLSKRHGKHLRNAALSEYTKAKNKWRDDLLTYSEYFNN